eukprot:8456978-Alexandrium_andersonii.AAC.1
MGGVQKKLPRVKRGGASGRRMHNCTIDHSRRVLPRCLRPPAVVIARCTRSKGVRQHGPLNALCAEGREAENAL